MIIRIYRAASNEFVSSSIPSWQILTANAQSFRGARGLAFCLKLPLDSLLVWVSSGGSGATAQMLSLAWIFAARIGDKYQIRLMRPYNRLWCADWKFRHVGNKACQMLPNSYPEWQNFLSAPKNHCISILFLAHSSLDNYISAAAWQNKYNGLCAQWRLRSAWASAQSDQSLRCPHEESLVP